MNNKLEYEISLGQFRVNHVKVPGIGTKQMAHYHAHECYEIYYLRSGERLYYINGKNYCVKKGEILLIDRNVIHKTTPTSVPDYERILLHVPKHFLDSKAFLDIDLTQCFHYHSPVVLLPKKDQTIIETKLYNIIEEAKNQHPGYLTAIQTLLVQILLRVNRYATSVNHQIDQNTHIHKKINQVVRYIGNNYMHDITLPQLSEEFHISNSHLSRTFKKVTGLTIIDYLNSVRVHQAQKLLRETDKSISEISCEIGFGSITHFGRVFKKASGYTPTEFRELVRNKITG